MSTEKDIKKWLNHELENSALDAFEQDPQNEDILAIDKGLQRIQVPEYDVSASWKNMQEQLSVSEAPETSSRFIIPNWIKVAAAIIIGFVLFQQLNTKSLEYNTAIAEQLTLTLPDQSEILLNAASTVSYSKKDWSDSREVSLKGEAYFKVAKGETFSVLSDAGVVTVLGTQFTVKDRDNYFEVVCYEGSVRVAHSTATQVLKPGDTFKVIDGKIIATEKETQSGPSWMNNESRFRSVPFKYVLEEFERQYRVKLQVENVDQNVLFTGSFANKNLNKALKAITLPLELDYRLNEENSITISSKN